MGIESRKLYDEICAEEVIDFDRKSSGIIHFYKSQEYYDNTLEVNKIYRENGLHRDVINPDYLKTIDPALASIQNVVGATATHSDWTGDIHKFCYQLSDILKNKYKVQFKFNSEVTTKYGMEMIAELFDATVVCAGVGSVELARQVGDTLDIYPVKGYSITINNVDRSFLPKVSLLDDQAKIVTSSLGNRFRVAGTAELNGENYDIIRNRIDPLLNWVHTNFPNINTHDYTSYACLRPMTPNMMPITKRSDKNSKVFYNTGHGHLGWTLGPVTAKLIADMI
jgi:D-amino-acid dehydrogenase